MFARFITSPLDGCCALWLDEVITRYGTHSINRSMLAFHLHVLLIIIITVMIITGKVNHGMLRIHPARFFSRLFRSHLNLFHLKCTKFLPILLSVMVFCGFTIHIPWLYGSRDISYLGNLNQNQYVVCLFCPSNQHFICRSDFICYRGIHVFPPIDEDFSA